MIGTNYGTQTFYSTLTFRLLLDALARPGKINQLESPQFWGEAPSYSSQATERDTTINLHALGALLALLDRETTFVMGANGQWFDRAEAAVRWTMLRSGSTLANPDQASFAFFCDGGNNELFAQLSVGTLLEPELSATAFFCVEQLADDLSMTHEEGITLELRGPGIQDVSTIHVAGLQASTLEAILFARKSYPLGIDVYLIDGAGCCVGLPRTTKIQLRAETR
ncbi:MAG TPA: phosphonate C-P lyase system protein PhnH [Ktedonobacteraceae bacterium]|jgi:alpha-D-ribose 1-methylphosphonate 5-triphosphate synthase subunit PhnH